jgi:hypothetical protein
MCWPSGENATDMTGQELVTPHSQFERIWLERDHTKKFQRRGVERDVRKIFRPTREVSVQSHISIIKGSRYFARENDRVRREQPKSGQSVSSTNTTYPGVSYA